MQIDSTLSSTTGQTAADAASRLPQQTLGQDDFLRLLMVQLTSQDPMSPMKDTDFIAQLAQFTALSQAKETTATINALRAEQQVQQANALIGRAVMLADDQNNLITGTVAGVLVDGGVPRLVVNGQSYDLSQLLSITTPAN
jgi:flagellar basal-body rod modification protein FlgD